MNLSETDQAILLLASHFSGTSKSGTKISPLSPIEYGRLSRWLHETNYKPADLFYQFDEIARQWVDPKGKITTDRLKVLLGRGASMGIALEKWTGAGIWVMTRATSEYPRRFKQRLKADAPPVLFGVGDPGLLDAGGIAIVGSRSIDAVDEAFAKQVAQSGASEGLNVVSGGAKGVDETAMKAALEVEGMSVGVLANGLFSAATSGLWRRHLRSKDLCLISPFSPESGFNVGNAMGRNKYIYCLADYAVVVRSDKKKGGTWAGATEAMKKQLAPVFVRKDSEAPGNAALIELGAQPLACPEEPLDGWLRQALTGSAWATEAPESTRQTEEVANSALPLDDKRSTGELPTATADAPGPEARVQPAHPPETAQQDNNEKLSDPEPFYSLFCRWLVNILSEDVELSQKEIKERQADLVPSQLKLWIDKALAEGVIVLGSGKGKRYTLPPGTAKQKSLL